MRRKISLVSTLFALFFALAATRADAQSIGEMRAHIPFDFVAGERTLPAGDYALKRIIASDSTALILQNIESGASVALRATLQGENKKNEFNLVFKSYGAERFLSQMSVVDYKLRVYPSKRELEWRQRTAERKSGDATASVEIKTITIPLTASRL